MSAVPFGRTLQRPLQHGSDHVALIPEGTPS